MRTWIDKLKTLSQRVNPRSRKVIIAAALFIAISLSVFILSLSKSQEPNAPEWQTYEEQVKEGEIEPAGKVLEAVVSYKSSGKVITIAELNRKNGYATSDTSDNPAFTIQLLNKDQEVLSQQTFSIETTVRAETIDDKGVIHGKDVALLDGSYVVNLPFYDSAARVRVLDRNNTQVASSGLENMKVIDNKPNFKSITGDKILHRNEGKLNFDFMVSKVFAQGNDQKLDIVFIGDNYSDMGQFHRDVDLFANTLLEYEPYKTRAAQIAFHYVDNTVDLECGSVNGTRAAGCNYQTVRQEVNNAGVPYDKISVIVNTDEYMAYGSDISISSNGVHGPHIFVHEFGHSFGKLIDEYAYDGEAKEGIMDGNVYRYGDNFNSLAIDYGNCFAGDPPASQWEGHAQADGYRKRCGYLNWSASTETSIMQKIDVPSARFFNRVSQDVINRRFDALLAGETSNIYVPRDIYAINRRGGSGMTEVHQLRAGADFKEFSLHAVSGLHPTDNADWAFALGFYDGDNIVDIFAINRNGGSGKTEAHILSGGSDFKDFVLQTATGLHQTTGNNWVFVGGNFDGDGKTDLYAINKQGGSGKTEVHVLSGKSDFKEFALHGVSGLHTTDKNWSFYAAGSKGGGSIATNHDSLFAINRRGGSGKTEVHILNARSNFSEFNFQGVLPLEPTDNANWVFAGGAFDISRDIFVDIYAINRNGGSGKTEAHVMADADRFESFYLQTGTALHPVDDKWTFANAQDYVTVATPSPTARPTQTPTVKPVTPTPTKIPVTPTPTPTPPIGGPNPTTPPNPTGPVPTWVCGGSPHSVCATPTPTPRPTTRPGDPTPTQIAPTRIVTAVPSVTPAPNTDQDDCLDVNQTTPEKIMNWIQGFFRKISDFIQRKQSNSQDPTAPPQPCIRQ